MSDATAATRIAPFKIGCQKASGVQHLSPTTLTNAEQRAILQATAGHAWDHLIFPVALGTGLRLPDWGANRQPSGLNRGTCCDRQNGRLTPTVASRLSSVRRVKGFSGREV